MDDEISITHTAAGHRPRLAVICGLPATGKSTLADHVHQTLGWPLLSKDVVKELLFDTGEYQSETFTRAQSMALGRQSLALVFRFAEQLLEAGHSCILEANFLPSLAPADFARLSPLADLRQIHCTIPDSLVLARYAERAATGQRHPVHNDLEAVSELQNRIDTGAGQPLPLPGRLLQVETTNGYRPTLATIMDFLAS